MRLTVATVAVLAYLSVVMVDALPTPADDPSVKLSSAVAPAALAEPVQSDAVDYRGLYGLLHPLATEFLPPTTDGAGVGVLNASPKLQAALESIGLALQQAVSGAADITGHTTNGLGHSVPLLPPTLMKTIAQLDKGPVVRGLNRVLVGNNPPNFTP